jgi:hypothetical protein
MSLPKNITGVAVALVVSLAVAGAGRAADDSEAQVEARNQAAIAAYEAGNFAKMKKELLKAVSIGEDAELDNSPVMARTYVLSAILQIEGNNDRDAGVRLFAKAIKISADVQIPKGMATTPVKMALKQARGDGEPPAEAAPPAEKPEKAEKKETTRSESAAKAKEEKAREERNDEKERSSRDLAEARDNENRERVEKERLQKDKFEKDKALADAKGRLEMAEEAKQQKDKALTDSKGRVQQLEKEKLDLEKAKQALEKDKLEKDKALADARGRLQMAEEAKQQKDKAIAEGKDREKKERDAKEKLEKERPEREKLLADAKARVQQLEKDKAQLEKDKQGLEKDKADRDKLLAESRDREKKEHEAREKAEKAKQWAESNVRERESRDEQVRAERDRLAEGPDLPSHISEPLYCTVPDEVPTGNDLFVHCVPQASGKTKVVAFYYRPSGVAQYNALIMERSKKGWFTAVIPASRITGKALQYYAEARDAREEVFANNGKSNSPNTLIVRSQSAHAPTAARRAPSSR